jgi:hypothetical protein
MYQVFYEVIRDFFGQAKHLGREVPVIFASPDRAHSELMRIMKRRLQGKKESKGEADLAPPTATKQAIEDKPASVPFMSVWSEVPNFDPSRYGVGRFVTSKNKQTGCASVMRFPQPVAANVQVDLWCGSKAGHKIAYTIMPQIDLRFYAESAYLPVDWSLDKWYRPPFDALEHAKVLGQTRIRLMREGGGATGWIDNTDLESEDGQKDVRLTWRGRFEAFIPYMPTEARLVRTVQFELYDLNDTPPALVFTVDAGSED